jgi:hypothetical protein
MSTPTFGQSAGPNLLKIESFSQIIKEDGISISKEDLDGVGILRLSVINPSRPDAAVYFATLKVTPGEKYTFMISSQPHTVYNCAHFITSDIGNIVWPGSLLVDGISASQFTVPDSASTVTVAFAFQNAQAGDFIVIHDIGLFKGFVAPSDWQFNEEEGLQPVLLIKGDGFEILAIIASFIVVVLIIVMEKRIPNQPPL